MSETSKNIPYTDENRIRAYELQMEISNGRYIMIALQKEAERIKLAMELLQRQAAEEQEKINNNEKRLTTLVDTLRSDNNVPDTHDIDLKTGNIVAKNTK